ncbi:Thioredoxin [Prauserella aidingensis]|uniref:thioredoxin family protein n=1 Tax=Prauserella aidingensis TaxID=387890 RepID=UPI0020A53DFE|nr:thioredoxin family protein [Prauserella aidingensis]MCP2253568.1 Thioredoxin [Prauserella aidingensis]
MTGVIVAGVTLVAAVVVGLVVRARNGRIRPSGGSSSDGAAPGGAADSALDGLPTEVRDAVTGEAAEVTLVQLSTTFCAPCRHTRALLTHVAERTDGLRHVDLDVTDKPDIARDLGVLRTPTTIAYARSGAELLRVSGVPKREELLAALEPRLPDAESAAQRSE